MVGGGYFSFNPYKKWEKNFTDSKLNVEHKMSVVPT